MPSAANPRQFPSLRAGGTAFFDIATTTGWAYGHPGEYPPACGAWELPKDHEAGLTGSALYDVLCDFMEWYEPTRLYAEAPLPPNATKSNMDTWLCLVGLIGVARAVAAQYGRTIRVLNARTIRANVLEGLRWNEKLSDGKPVIVQWCHDQGVVPPDHNAADALVGLEYSMRLYARKGWVRDLGN